jgi:hypothetical protein
MTPATGEADCREMCERLSIAFANYIDRRDYPALLDLFGEDAVIDRMGTIIRGKPAISAWLALRPVDVVTRHICSNIEIVQRGPETAEGLTYFTFYKAVGTADVCDVEGPELVGEYHDLFVLTVQGWKFKSRKITVIFKRRGA